MSVRTTADEKRDEAKQHLKEAFNCLIIVTDEDTYGANEYNDHYKEALEEALMLIRKARKLL